MRSQLALMALALVVGAFIGTQNSQAAGPAPFQANSWPPPPKAIVNWNVRENLVQQGLGTTVAGGQDLVLLDVPPGQWFIMTEVHLRATGTASEQSGSRLAERSGSTYRYKTWDIYHMTFPIERESGSAVGLAFAPGTQVVIRNEANPSDAFSVEEHSYFNGYFARAN